MFRAVTALCVIAVCLVSFEQVACHRHGWNRHGQHGHHQHHHGHSRHHHHRHGLFLSMDIYEPKGLEISTKKYNSTAQYFGFDMFINNPDGVTPDVSHNTTNVTYGKYIVRDTEVIIKPGDILNITFFMGFSDGGEINSTAIMPVYRHMIKNNCTCGNEADREAPSTPPVKSIPPWSRATTIPPRATSTRRPTPPPMRTTVPVTTTESSNWQQSTNDYSDELFDCEIDPTTNLCSYNSLIDVRGIVGSQRQPQKLVNHPDRDVNMNVFMDIFNAVIDQCRAKPRTNYLTLTSPVYSTDASIDWVGYVRKTLKERLNLTRLADKALVDAQPSGTAIVFEMDTLFNKLQVLYYARKLGMTSLKDYDEL
ncbi:uncharacterized protein LOC128714819 [Anopheles marshallii]|uniref:uncharacterized protein LOC128714819 n=1 Tax=Anopheles marshallii TaxID=1521116 RepID=UPI00237B4B63|nr:uncharacterized protein LOC128714819 [Anopheles marshallii]